MNEEREPDVVVVKNDKQISTDQLTTIERFSSSLIKDATPLFREWMQHNVEIETIKSNNLKEIELKRIEVLEKSHKNSNRSILFFVALCVVSYNITGYLKIDIAYYNVLTTAGFVILASQSKPVLDMITKAANTIGKITGNKD